MEYEDVDGDGTESQRKFVLNAIMMLTYKWDIKDMERDVQLDAEDRCQSIICADVSIFLQVSICC